MDRTGEHERRHEAALYAGLEARGRHQVDDAALGAVTLAPAKTASR